MYHPRVARWLRELPRGCECTQSGATSRTAPPPNQADGGKKSDDVGRKCQTAIGFVRFIDALVFAICAVTRGVAGAGVSCRCVRVTVLCVVVGVCLVVGCCARAPPHMDVGSGSGGLWV